MWLARNYFDIQRVEDTKKTSLNCAIMWSGAAVLNTIRKMIPKKKLQSVCQSCP